MRNGVYSFAFPPQKKLTIHLCRFLLKTETKARANVSIEFGPVPGRGVYHRWQITRKHTTTNLSSTWWSFNCTSSSETRGYIRTPHLLADSRTERRPALPVGDKELRWVALQLVRLDFQVRESESCIRFQGTMWADATSNDNETTLLLVGSILTIFRY